MPGTRPSHAAPWEPAGSPGAGLRRALWSIWLSPGIAATSRCPPVLRPLHPRFHSRRCCHRSVKMPRNPFAGGSVAIAVSASGTPRALGLAWRPPPAPATGSTLFSSAWNRIRSWEGNHLAQFPCRRLLRSLLVAERSGGHPGGHRVWGWSRGHGIWGHTQGTWSHVPSPASPAQPRAPPALATNISAPLGRPCTLGCCCLSAGGSSLHRPGRARGPASLWEQRPPGAPGGITAARSGAARAPRCCEAPVPHLPEAGTRQGLASPHSNPCVAIRRHAVHPASPARAALGAPVPSAGDQGRRVRGGRGVGEGPVSMPLWGADTGHAW